MKKEVKVLRLLHFLKILYNPPLSDKQCRNIITACQFGLFELSPAERILLHKGDRVLIFPKAFDVLLYLVERHGSLVEKQDLREAVWDGAFVEDGNLCVTVSMLRKALGLDEGGHQYIQTVSKHGYRFVAEVRPITRARLPPKIFDPVPDRADDAEGLERADCAPTLIAGIATPTPDPGTGFFPVAAPSRHLPILRGSGARYWLSLTAVCLIVAVTALYISRNWQSTPSRVLATHTAPIHSLGVLPFTTVGGTPDNAYLGVGMSTEITSKLANLGKVLVRPSSFMAKYASTLDPQTAARAQRVDVILDGQLRQVGSHVRLSVQLIRASDGGLIWGDEFDEQYTNIFEVQDAVSNAVAESILQTLSPADRKLLSRHSTMNTDAYEAYSVSVRRVPLDVEEVTQQVSA